MKVEAVNFFKNLYTVDRPINGKLSRANFFSLLIENELQSLCMDATELEVKNALDGISPLKAPGVDGLHVKFFQSQWDIVSSSVHHVVSDAFTGKNFDQSINNTFLVLVPKVNNPETISQYRPISLCLVICKIITKTLVNRLKSIMSKLTSPNQVSFVSGRSILDNIIISQEEIHSMRTTKDQTGWMAIKVDLEKAYNRIRWDFLHDTLLIVGLLVMIRKLIMNCVTTSTTQILWNGNVTSDFKPTHGVHQGNPLSPYLFILCMERLGHCIQ